MRARWVLAGFLSVISSPLFAAESDPPSLELLEFLGSWEDAQGNWVDPQTLVPSAVSGEETTNDTGNEQTNE